MTVNGKIKDNKGEILPFVNVFASDENGSPITPSYGTSSDVNGNYQIDTLGQQYISFRSIGYKSETIDVSNLNQNPNIVLNEDVALIPEFTIIGNLDVTEDTKKKLNLGLIISGFLLLIILLYFIFKKKK
jgi:hypothetical protein